MSDQELLDRIAQGDQAALTELCDRYAELIRKRAQWIARQYNCLRPGSHGGWSDYTKETLSELESVGMLTLIECAMNGGYDSSKGVFGTYNVPFLDGAMRRHLEASMGTLSLDRDSMGLVRKAQMLYHRDGKEMSEIAGELGVSLAEVARAVAYRDKSYRLSFDLVIEVTNALNDKPELLNDIYEQLVSVVRKSNHDRILMISPRLRSDSAYLSDLEIPSDANGYLMAEWHFYAAGPSKTNEKKLWTTGTPAERQLVQSKIDKALQWQRETGIPTWVGAWMPGNYNDGNDYTLDEQLAFASFVAQALEDASIPFAVNSDTKFYDRVEKRWYSEMLPLTMELFQPESLPFSDVPEGAWYYDSLLYVYQNGIFSGTSATTFSPYQNMTRQQLWTVLGRMAGEKLSGSGVYSAARSWAIRAGVSDGSDPTGTLSRQQLVMLLWRFAGEPTSVQDLSGFSDAAQVSSYAKKAMSWAVENQILTGSGGCLLPHGTATRAQVAAILSRFSIGS